MNDERDGPVGKRGRYHHRELRSHLLRVACAEIARHGAQDVSLSSLARLAGVSQPAPYHHFSDRRALLEAVAADAFSALAQRLADAVAGQQPEAILETLALAYVGFGEANIEIYRLMFASRFTPKAANGSALDVAASEAFGLLRDTLSASSAFTDAAETGPAELDRHVYRVWARLHGLVMLKADGFIARPLAYYVGDDRRPERAP